MKIAKLSASLLFSKRAPAIFRAARSSGLAPPYDSEHKPMDAKFWR
jgi:hypothetical protein